MLKQVFDIITTDFPNQLFDAWIDGVNYRIADYRIEGDPYDTDNPTTVFLQLEGYGELQCGITSVLEISVIQP